MGRSEYEREAERERRRAYYEQLSPQEKREYRQRRIREKKLKQLKKMAKNNWLKWKTKNYSISLQKFLKVILTSCTNLQTRNKLF